MSFIQASTTATNTIDHNWESVNILIRQDKLVEINQTMVTKQAQYDAIQQGISQGWVFVLPSEE